MYQVVRKDTLNPVTRRMDILAPRVAKKAEPGQFIIFRVNEDGERVPLTIAGYDRDAGTVTVIFQEVGKSTRMLGALEVGETVLDFVGPLGVASHFDSSIRRAAVIGGGLGSAIAWPQAKKLHEMGVHVDAITGFRNADLVILGKEMADASSACYTMTDDGSNGNKGFVTGKLKELMDQGAEYDLVIAIGPLPMMGAVCELTRPFGIRTIVSMNPVMIDGTGMCGGCRLTVGGKTRFACVDGPDFDGHEVDFEEAMRRQGMYRKEERHKDEEHICRMTGEER